MTSASTPISDLCPLNDAALSPKHPVLATSANSLGQISDQLASHLQGISIHSQQDKPLEQANAKARDKRRVEARAIRRRLANIRPQDCHPQTQSPLFGILPPEIRNEVFELAVSEYEDMAEPYSETAIYYRPGHRAPRRVHTALLRTCRLVYYETNAIPMRSATHYHWNLYGNPGARVPRYAEMTAKNIAELNHVHIFLGRREVKDQLKKLTEISQFRPKIITITVRHPGWYDWAQLDQRLQFEPGWLSKLLPNECNKFRLELESTDSKKKELEELAQSLRERKFTKRNGQSMRIADGEPKTWSWTGRPDLFALRWELHGPKTFQDTINYHVIVLTWVPRPPETPPVLELRDTVLET